MLSEPSESSAAERSTWFSRLFGAINTLIRSVRIRRRQRALRVCEMLPLGDKRFLAIVQFEGRRFLIGATNQSISLIDRLDSSPSPRRKRESSLEGSFLGGVH